ncbi:MAG: hypothetical protein KKI08_27785 [Armatimonadetes bacterium]|nr:hypothetical protein [Armatimonadota bacterium]
MRATRLASLAVLVLSPALAFAADPAPPPGTLVDRLIFTVGVLIAFALGIERVCALLVKVLGRVWEWLKTQWPKLASALRADDPTTEDPAAHAFRVIIAVPLAFYANIDTIDMLNHGRLATTLADGPSHTTGVILTGLIASMGSAFLTQLLDLLKAIRDLRREQKEFYRRSGRSGGAPPLPGPTPDPAV